jgi:hypothetical protein
MNAREQLDLYYRRFPGVSQNFGERFLPLIERGLAAEAEIGARILQLVESSFEKEHMRRAGESALRQTQERKVLEVVAGVLHAWNPPDWLLQWRN